MSSDTVQRGSKRASLPIEVMSHELMERVLAKLGFAAQPVPTLESLRSIYAAWCRRVPFDNVRKLIHVRANNPGPLPGSTPEDFFEAWLEHGTGGTCWSGAGALHALLAALGFSAERGIATMLVTPDLPPNHGTVRVTFGEKQFLVDSSILHGEPLRLEEKIETRVPHQAWGVRCSKRDGRWHLLWRPLNRLDGFVCRFERFGASADEYTAFYDKTRGWSPFNYQVTARVNRDNRVVGVAMGQAVSLERNGSARQTLTTHSERVRVLIEEIGLSEKIVSQLPEDQPTPPPPWSQTAQVASKSLR